MLRPLLLVIMLLFAAGCLGTPAPEESSYAVDEDGHLTLAAPPPDAAVTVLEEQGCVTVSSVIFRNGNGTDVHALLAEPDRPGMAIVFAPGAGVPAEAHRERAVRYAEAGIAFLVVDIRGNGGETPGEPFNLDMDYHRFAGGEWPQYYRIVADLSGARQVLAGRTGVPVVAMGSSNGGRYAAVAAATDPGFAGYIGISTSGFGRAGDGYTGDARRFLLSIDPDACVARITPRSVTIFHAEGDPIIPYADGQALFDHAGEPKECIAFNGTHGICSEVDDSVIAESAQFYAPVNETYGSLKSW
ncbi:alpha/beta hydrolase [Methanoculleus sp. FWC-SCC1]|uniref:Alpha/beta hydrolase n=1 Tax=Methanoculleus frigidifontis TaxID=2584085 RepID=A0ABT8MAQ4_9EURY|nr:alpha/beta hydrolase [Methanoculleus sp. FWC-SCC1]MDN7025014.1 alpha/beta hydrolase [Methanoculleus sp. FWC-SCC1]